MADAERLDLTAVRDRANTAVNPVPKDKRVPREITLGITYTDPDTGASLRADVQSCVLDGPQRRTRARTAADLAGGQLGQLALAEQARMSALATLVVALKEPPEWVLKWAEQDDALLFSIAQEVERHDRLYFRGHSAPSGTPAAGRQLAVVSPLAPDPNDG